MMDSQRRIPLNETCTKRRNSGKKNTSECLCSSCVETADLTKYFSQTFNSRPLSQERNNAPEKNKERLKNEALDERNRVIRNEILRHVAEIPLRIDATIWDQIFDERIILLTDYHSGYSENYELDLTDLNYYLQYRRELSKLMNKGSIINDDENEVEERDAHLPDVRPSTRVSGRSVRDSPIEILFNSESESTQKNEIEVITIDDPSSPVNNGLQTEAAARIRDANEHTRGEINVKPSTSRFVDQPPDVLKTSKSSDIHQPQKTPLPRDFVKLQPHQFLNCVNGGHVPSKKPSSEEHIEVFGEERPSSEMQRDTRGPTSHNGRIEHSFSPETLSHRHQEIIDLSLEDSSVLEVAPNGDSNSLPSHPNTVLKQKPQTHHKLNNKLSIGEEHGKRSDRGNQVKKIREQDSQEDKTLDEGTGLRLLQKSNSRTSSLEYRQKCAANNYLLSRNQNCSFDYVSGDNSALLEKSSTQLKFNSEGDRICVSREKSATANALVEGKGEVSGRFCDQITSKGRQTVEERDQTRNIEVLPDDYFPEPFRPPITNNELNDIIAKLDRDCTNNETNSRFQGTGSNYQANTSRLNLHIPKNNRTSQNSSRGNSEVFKIRTSVENSEIMSSTPSNVYENRLQKPNSELHAPDICVRHTARIKSSQNSRENDSEVYSSSASASRTEKASNPIRAHHKSSVLTERRMHRQNEANGICSKVHHLAAFEDTVTHSNLNAIPALKSDRGRDNPTCSDRENSHCSSHKNARFIETWVCGQNKTSEICNRKRLSLLFPGHSRQPHSNERRSVLKSDEERNNRPCCGRKDSILPERRMATCETLNNDSNEANVRSIEGHDSLEDNHSALINGAENRRIIDNSRKKYIDENRDEPADHLVKCSLSEDQSNQSQCHRTNPHLKPFEIKGDRCSSHGKSVLPESKKATDRVSYLSNFFTNVVKHLQRRKEKKETSLVENHPVVDCSEDRWNFDWVRMEIESEEYSNLAEVAKEENGTIPLQSTSPSQINQQTNLNKLCQSHVKEDNSRSPHREESAVIQRVVGEEDNAREVNNTSNARPMPFPHPPLSHTNHPVSDTNRSTTVNSREYSPTNAMEVELPSTENTMHYPDTLYQSLRLERINHGDVINPKISTPSTSFDLQHPPLNLQIDSVGVNNHAITHNSVSGSCMLCKRKTVHEKNVQQQIMSTSCTATSFGEELHPSETPEIDPRSSQIQNRKTSETQKRNSFCKNTAKSGKDLEDNEASCECTITGNTRSAASASSEDDRSLTIEKPCSNQTSSHKVVSSCELEDDVYSKIPPNTNKVSAEDFSQIATSASLKTDKPDYTRDELTLQSATAISSLHTDRLKPVRGEFCGGLDRAHDESITHNASHTNGHNIDRDDTAQNVNQEKAHNLKSPDVFSQLKSSPVSSSTADEQKNTEDTKIKINVNGEEKKLVESIKSQYKTESCNLHLQENSTDIQDMQRNFMGITTQNSEPVVNQLRLNVTVSLSNVELSTISPNPSFRRLNVSVEIKDPTKCEEDDPGNSTSDKTSNMNQVKQKYGDDSTKNVKMKETNKNDLNVNGTKENKLEHSQNGSTSVQCKEENKTGGEILSTVTSNASETDIYIESNIPSINAEDGTNNLEFHSLQVNEEENVLKHKRIHETGDAVQLPEFLGSNASETDIYIESNIPSINAEDGTNNLEFHSLQVNEEENVLKHKRIHETGDAVQPPEFLGSNASETDIYIESNIPSINAEDGTNNLEFHSLQVNEEENVLKHKRIHETGDAVQPPEFLGSNASETDIYIESNIPSINEEDGTNNLEFHSLQVNEEENVLKHKRIHETGDAVQLPEFLGSNASETDIYIESNISSINAEDGTNNLEFHSLQVNEEENVLKHKRIHETGDAVQPPEFLGSNASETDIYIESNIPSINAEDGTNNLEFHSLQVNEEENVLKHKRIHETGDAVQPPEFLGSNASETDIYIESNIPSINAEDGTNNLEFHSLQVNEEENVLKHKRIHETGDAVQPPEFLGSNASETDIYIESNIPSINAEDGTNNLEFHSLQVNEEENVLKHKRIHETGDAVQLPEFLGSNASETDIYIESNISSINAEDGTNNLEFHSLQVNEEENVLKHKRIHETGDAVQPPEFLGSNASETDIYIESNIPSINAEYGTNNLEFHSLQVNEEENVLKHKRIHETGDAVQPPEFLAKTSKRRKVCKSAPPTLILRRNSSTSESEKDSKSEKWSIISPLNDHDMKARKRFPPEEQGGISRRNSYDLHAKKRRKSLGEIIAVDTSSIPNSLQITDDLHNEVEGKRNIPKTTTHSNKSTLDQTNVKLLNRKSSSKEDGIFAHKRTEIATDMDEKDVLSASLPRPQIGMSHVSVVSNEHLRQEKHLDFRSENNVSTTECVERGICDVRSEFRKQEAKSNWKKVSACNSESLPGKKGNVCSTPVMGDASDGVKAKLSKALTISRNGSTDTNVNQGAREQCKLYDDNLQSTGYNDNISALETGKFTSKTCIDVNPILQNTCCNSADSGNEEDVSNKLSGKGKGKRTRKISPSYRANRRHRKEKCSDREINMAASSLPGYFKKIFGKGGKTSDETKNAKIPNTKRNVIRNTRSKNQEVIKLTNESMESAKIEGCTISQSPTSRVSVPAIKNSNDSTKRNTNFKNIKINILGEEQVAKEKIDTLRFLLAQKMKSHINKMIILERSTKEKKGENEFTDSLPQITNLDNHTHEKQEANSKHYSTKEMIDSTEKASAKSLDPLQSTKGNAIISKTISQNSPRATKRKKWYTYRHRVNKSTEVSKLGIKVNSRSKMTSRTSEEKRQKSTKEVKKNVEEVHHNVKRKRESTSDSFVKRKKRKKRNQAIQTNIIPCSPRKRNLCNVLRTRVKRKAKSETKNTSISKTVSAGKANIHVSSERKYNIKRKRCRNLELNKLRTSANNKIKDSKNGGITISIPLDLIAVHSSVEVLTAITERVFEMKLEENTLRKTRGIANHGKQFFRESITNASTSSKKKASSNSLTSLTHITNCSNKVPYCEDEDEYEEGPEISFEHFQYDTDPENRGTLIIVSLSDNGIEMSDLYLQGFPGLIEVSSCSERPEKNSSKTVEMYSISLELFVSTLSEDERSLISVQAHDATMVLNNGLDDTTNSFDKELPRLPKDDRCRGNMDPQRLYSCEDREITLISNRNTSEVTSLQRNVEQSVILDEREILSSGNMCINHPSVNSSATSITLQDASVDLNVLTSDRNTSHSRVNTCHSPKNQGCSDRSNLDSSNHLKTCVTTHSALTSRSIRHRFESLVRDVLSSPFETFDNASGVHNNIILNESDLIQTERNYADESTTKRHNADYSRVLCVCDQAHEKHDQESAESGNCASNCKKSYISEYIPSVKAFRQSESDQLCGVSNSLNGETECTPFLSDSKIPDHIPEDNPCVNPELECLETNVSSLTSAEKSTDLAMKFAKKKCDNIDKHKPQNPTNILVTSPRLTEVKENMYKTSHCDCPVNEHQPNNSNSEIDIDERNEVSVDTHLPEILSNKSEQLHRHYQKKTTSNVTCSILGTENSQPNTENSTVHPESSESDSSPAIFQQLLPTNIPEENEIEWEKESSPETIVIDDSDFYSGSDIEEIIMEIDLCGEEHEEESLRDIDCFSLESPDSPSPEVQELQASGDAPMSTMTHWRRRRWWRWLQRRRQRIACPASQDPSRPSNPEPPSIPFVLSRWTSSRRPLDSTDFVSDCSNSDDELRQPTHPNRPPETEFKGCKACRSHQGSCRSTKPCVPATQHTSRPSQLNPSGDVFPTDRRLQSAFYISGFSPRHLAFLRAEDDRRIQLYRREQKVHSTNAARRAKPVPSCDPPPSGEEPPRGRRADPRLWRGRGCEARDGERDSDDSSELKRREAAAQKMARERRRHAIARAHSYGLLLDVPQLSENDDEANDSNQQIETCSGDGPSTSAGEEQERPNYEDFDSGGASTTVSGVRWRTNAHGVDTVDPPTGQTGRYWSDWIFTTVEEGHALRAESFRSRIMLFREVQLQRRALSRTYKILGIDKKQFSLECLSGPKGRTLGLPDAESTSSPSCNNTSGDAFPHDHADLDDHNDPSTMSTGENSTTIPELAASTHKCSANCSCCGCKGCCACNRHQICCASCEVCSEKRQWHNHGFESKRRHCDSLESEHSPAKRTREISPESYSLPEHGSPSFSSSSSSPSSSPPIPPPPLPSADDPVVPSRPLKLLALLVPYTTHTNQPTTTTTTSSVHFQLTDQSVFMLQKPTEVNSSQNTSCNSNTFSFTTLSLADLQNLGISTPSHPLVVKSVSARTPVPAPATLPPSTQVLVRTILSSPAEVNLAISTPSHPLVVQSVPPPTPVPAQAALRPPTLILVPAIIPPPAKENLSTSTPSHPLVAQPVSEPTPVPAPATLRPPTQVLVPSIIPPPAKKNLAISTPSHPLVVQPVPAPTPVTAPAALPPPTQILAPSIVPPPTEMNLAISTPAQPLVVQRVPPPTPVPAPATLPPRPQIRVPSIVPPPAEVIPTATVLPRAGVLLPRAVLPSHVVATPLPPPYFQFHAPRRVNNPSASTSHPALTRHFPPASFAMPRLQTPYAPRPSTRTPPSPATACAADATLGTSVLHLAVVPGASLPASCASANENTQRPHDPTKERAV